MKPAPHKNINTKKREKKMANILAMIRSSVHLKIVRFFHENQASIDTPRGVSTWVREEKSIVKRALEDLVALKVLIAHRATSTTGYSYTQNGAMVSKIGKILRKTP